MEKKEKKREKEREREKRKRRERDRRDSTVETIGEVSDDVQTCNN